MCGIAGLYNLPGQGDTLPAMLDAIAHRGPDARAEYTANGSGPPVRLGHLRLSIIDLSDAANQPFRKDGLVLVYNGEIYNYMALRKKLEGEGVAFRTNSDTEVLMEAWRSWGPASLRRLRGMFAFALYDENTRRLVLARDHFGIKPLFFTRTNGGLAFGSELKALRPVLRDGVSINTTALVASLMYYWIPDSQCVYRGVEKLPPGTWAEISPNGELRQETYWDPAVELGHPVEREVPVEELRAIIEDSVRAHMVADVPVFTFLSGGIDSSLITAIAATVNQDLESYTISFRPEDQRLEAMPDDLRYANILADKLGIKLHQIEIAPDVATMLPEVVDILDEPIGDAAAINTVLICRAAREAGVKVLLSGMGADELFGGYRKHYAALLAAQYRHIPRFLRSGVIAPLVGALPVAGARRGYRTVRWAKRFLAFADMAEEPGFRRSYTHYGVDDFARLLNPDLMPSVHELVEEHAEIYAQGPPDSQVNRMCYTDVRLFMNSLNLAYTDRASMSASTEVRVPYIDIDVVAAAFSISGRRKIDGRERKAVLKRAAEPWLPREIVYRPKGLFSAPLRAWIRRDLVEMTNDLLLGGRLVESGMLNGDEIRTMLEDDRKGHADKSKEIWQLLTLETWLRRQPASL